MSNHTGLTGKTMINPKILTFPEDKKILRKKSKPVENWEEYKDTIKVMKHILESKPEYRGLSAVQIGKPVNIITIKLYNKPYHGHIITLVNPTIVANSEETFEVTEGCLSCPGSSVTMKRWPRIMAKYLKPEANTEITYEFLTIDAVAIQHEIDHLSGKLIIDNEQKS